MREQMTKLGLGAVAVVLAACMPVQAPLTDADRAAIDQLRETYRQAVVANDAAAIAALYTADGVEMAPNMTIAQGSAAIEERNSIPMAVTQFMLHPAETAGTGDLAYERGTFMFTGTPEGMPVPIDDTGKYMVVLRKQADGSWKFAAAIWNSDLPMPMPMPMPT